jgi:hypothetical protein
MEVEPTTDLVAAFDWPRKHVCALRAGLGDDVLRQSALLQAQTFSTHFSGMGTFEFAHQTLVNIWNLNGFQMPSVPTSCCVSAPAASLTARR